MAAKIVKSTSTTSIKKIKPLAHPARNNKEHPINFSGNNYRVPP
jgi:hypothetical protein